MSRFIRNTDWNELGETGFLAIHHGDLSILDEEGEVEDVFHRVGEARWVADELIEVDGLLMVLPEFPAKVVMKCLGKNEGVIKIRGFASSQEM